MTKKNNTVRHPVQPVVMDTHGVARFKKNEIVRYLLDKGPFDLNHLAMKDFSQEDYEQFAQLIGYSVSGSRDLSYISNRVYRIGRRRVKKLLEEQRDTKLLDKENNDIVVIRPTHLCWVSIDDDDWNGATFSNYLNVVKGRKVHLVPGPDHSKELIEGMKRAFTNVQCEVTVEE